MKKEQTNDSIVTLFFTCPMCGKTHSLNVPYSLVQRVDNRRENGEYIQDILKDYNRFDREKFITGYCDSCQELIFGIKREDI